MALKVEDGTGVTGADSLVSRATYIAYAAAVGVTIADADAADQELREAMRVIDSVEPRMQGVRESRDQALSFPRSGMIVNGWGYASDEIPQAAKDAQMELALYINAGNDPYNPEERKIVTQERVEGAVDIRYAVGAVASNTKGERWQLLLRKLLRSSDMLLERV